MNPLIDAHFAVATTPAQLDLPAGVADAVVLNSGTCDVVVNNRNDVSLDPLSGQMLRPGFLVQMSAYDGVNLQLWAVAAGRGGVVTLDPPSD